MPMISVMVNELSTATLFVSALSITASEVLGVPSVIIGSIDFWMLYRSLSNDWVHAVVCLVLTVALYLVLYLAFYLALYLALYLVLNPARYQSL